MAQPAFGPTQSGPRHCLPSRDRGLPRPTQASVGLRGGSGWPPRAAAALASPSGQLSTLWSSPILGSTSSTQEVPPLLAWKVPTQEARAPVRLTVPVPDLRAVTAVGLLMFSVLKTDVACVLSVCPFRRGVK